MNENNELLLYMYKNVDMGVKSTTKLIKLLNQRDNKIKNVVEGQLKGYENFYKKIKSLLKSNKVEPKGSSLIAEISSSIAMDMEFMKDNSDAKICPNMFIDLDDVSAKHGSVIGTFNNEQIFYLMSKGISYYDSLKLLIKGCLLADLVVAADKRMKILEIIDRYWR